MRTSLIQKIPFGVAIKLLLALSGATIVFHILVLAGVIPYEIVWGGRLETISQMRVFEGISIAINLLIAAATLTRGGYIKSVLPAKFFRIFFWALFAVFFLNTLGNVFSESTTETKIFTPLTLAAAVLCYRVAREDAF